MRAKAPARRPCTAADGAGALADNAGAAVGNAFDLTKAKLADVKFPEIKTSGITVRGNDDY